MSEWSKIFQQKLVVEALTGGALAVAGSTLMGGGSQAAIIAVGAPTVVGSLVANAVVGASSWFSGTGDEAIGISMAKHGLVGGAAAVAIMSIGGLDGVAFDANTFILVTMIGAAIVGGVYVADNYLSRFEGKASQ